MRERFWHVLLCYVATGMGEQIPRGVMEEGKENTRAMEKKCEIGGECGRKQLSERGEAEMDHF